jgi:hypothetical protein
MTMIKIASNTIRKHKCYTADWYDEAKCANYLFIHIGDKNPRTCTYFLTNIVVVITDIN